MRKHFFLINLLIISLIHTNASSTPQYNFEKFTYNEKLPSNSVTRIYHDKEGYMWFGTKDGLCRFDGYDIKVFRSSALTPGKLTNNEIQCITEDNDQKLWVGTLEGIFIVDKKRYTIQPLDVEHLKKERINSIITDSRGYIWIGTSSYGAIRMHPKTGSFERFSTDKNSRLKFKGNSVSNIYEDSRGKIWFSFWNNGLCYIDKDLQQIHNAPNIGKSNNPFRFFQDKEGVYWICTWGDGMFNLTVDAGGKMMVHPILLSDKSTQKLDEIVYSIVQDNKQGYIWVVTFSGLRIIEKEKDGTCTVVDADALFNESVNKLFHDIIKDRRGNLWIGSEGDGLYKLDFNKLSIQNYPLNEIKNSLNVQPYVTHMCELSSDEVYIAINRTGLFRFNLSTGEVKRTTNPVAGNLHSISAMIHLSKSDEIWLADEGEAKIHVFKNNRVGDLEQIRSISLNNSGRAVSNTINNLFEDSKGNVWIGTTNGLYLKSLNSAVVLVSAKFKNVTAIGEDTDKTIWIGTEKEGVFLCKTHDRGRQTSYVFSKISLNIGSYHSYNVQSICCTKNGNVYIGTKEGCLYFYNHQKKSASDISGLYGITEEGILDIIEDKYGLLWISTIKRVIRYNPGTHAASYYSSVNGMFVSSFFKDACVRLKSGQVLFGGNNGICAFTPINQTTPLHPVKQHVALTDIQIQNKSIFDDELKHHYDAKKNRVSLKYSENNLSIEFSALDYSSASKSQYAYMLSGINDNWNYVGNNRRFVNYANLPVGNYTFMVKASDENGLWSNQYTSLEVEILPPFYRTWWAYLLYLLIFVSAILFVLRTIANRIRLRNELKISHIEKEKSEELAQVKLRYFTNISHELLTPLTIIMLMIERLQKKNGGDSTQFDIMKDNIIRLKRLIQQILIFRKTESGNMKLKIQQNDVVGFVNNICQSNFNPLIDEKEINFSINTDFESYLAFFDPDKLDKIIYNLLSNAFKHTPKGGSISVKMSFVTRNEETLMRLSVSDNGEGISEKDLPHIFKRFYISSSSDQSQSHGIGLALTNDLLQIHKGNIEVKSQLGEGAVFTIEIPVAKESYTAEELSIEDAEIIDFPELPDIVMPETTHEGEEIENEKKFTILVVEDHRELKHLIVENFENKYNVLSAENGIQALEIIRENDIDLIISDVMMSEMDGLTFCKIIKNDIESSHINILMLTARTSTEDRIDCYNAGADAYIAKPFELAVLDARVKNLICKRQQKTVNFRKNKEINISSMEYGSMDEVFLKQAVFKVEEKLADDTFDFDQFAVNMATSKSTLHRKLKSLTGLSPGEFIRSVRLKHATQMLTNNVGNISEIAFALGFNDPKYFSRCFKNEFGLTPKEYQESKKA